MSTLWSQSGGILVIRTTLLALVALSLAVIAAPVAAQGQPPAKVLRIGYLTARSGGSHLDDAFRQALRELGYTEGENIAILHRSSEGISERLPDYAAELVRLKVDVIVAATTPAIHAAQQATRTIPIVMAVSSDPVATGFVASLAQPGGNITGLSFQTPELSAKQLELLKEAVPKVSRVAVLWNAPGPIGTLMLKETGRAAQSLGVQLQSLEVRSSDDLGKAFQAATRRRSGALLVLAGPMLFSHRKRIVELAAESRLPAMYGVTEYAQDGGLMAYSPNLLHLYRRAATFVDKILKGAKPADLPVEQPTRFELVINMKTAKALGLTIPPSILIRADQVIQ